MKMFKGGVSSVGSKSGVYLHTLQCLNRECGQKVRLGKHQDEVVTIGNFTYCPSCGGKAYSGQDNDRNYWEVLAESYEVDVELVKQMYDIWDRNEFQRFGDFVHSLKKEAGIV